MALPDPTSLIFPAVLIGGVLVLKATYRSSFEKALARELDGWDADSGAQRLLPGVRGRFRGRRVTISHKSRGDGESWETNVKLSHGGDDRLIMSVDARSRIVAQTSIGSGKIETVETGDPAFDKRYAVKANDAAQAQFLLDADTRRALLDLEAFGVVVDRFTVNVTLSDRVRDATPIGDALGIAERIATRL